MKNRPAILTVTVEGRDQKSPAGQASRVALVERVGAWITKSEIKHLDAVVFPGGFGFFKDYKNHQNAITDAARRMADHLAQRGLFPQIILGFDTAPYRSAGKRIGGQQLALAFNVDGPSGFARKIFPVDEDVDGRTMPPLVVQKSDYNDPRRVIDLPNGSRALLCVCYDMFGIADAVRDHPARLEKFVPGSVAQFQSFRNFLHAEKPDVAIATIHRFAKAGVDRFWQRHGIASASAALGKISAKDSFAIAAAHVGHLKDGDINGCRLASCGVAEKHLDAGSNRRTETLDPRVAQMVTVPGCRALLRLFQP
ncbi:MAG: hypothetical protein ACXW4B_08975 [Micavibrio sp.]